jgi:NitT/TauT family transport system substrate-binding protein
MNRRRTLASLSAAALLQLPRAVLAQNGPALRVIGPPNDGYKAVYYAQQGGLFRKYGLNVSPSVINSGAAAAAALIGGAADIAFTNPTALTIAHTRGIAMQALCPGGLITPANSGVSRILVLKDGPVHSGKDLNGATIGAVALGDTMAVSIRAWIDKTGGDSKTVKLIEVPASASLQMLVEGRVVAAGVNEPAASQAIETGKARSIANPLDAIGNAFLGGLLAVMTPYATANADALSRFARAIHEAQVYTNSHLPDTVNLVAGYSGIAPEVIARSARVIDAEYVEARNLQPLIDALAKYGTIERGFPASEIISPLALKPGR